MTKVFITGARGFIGRQLCRHLSKKGMQVIGLGHGAWSKEQYTSWGLNEWIEGDVNAANLKKLQQVFGAPDIIFHAAGGASVGFAISNPNKDYERTVTSTVALLEWMRLEAHDASLIALSSAAVYGSGYDTPINEDAQKNPFSPYGYHKRVMELLCQSYNETYGMKVIIARLFSVFGPELRKQLIWDICTKLETNPSTLILQGTGQEQRDWTDIRDVVYALELISNDVKEKMQIINIGTGTGTNVKSIAMDLISTWSNLSDQKIELQFTKHSRGGDPFSLIADSNRLDALGFKWKIPLTEGLTNYVKWYRSQSEVK